MRQDNRRFDVEAIKRANPIENIVAGYGIQLRRSGRALVGLCPFHNDRDNPNFYVYPDTQSWFCYACVERNGRRIGGDVIRFVELFDGLHFKEAAEKLAAGSPPPASSAPAPARRPAPRWERLPLDQQDVLNRVGDHYCRALWDTPDALAYVRRRGIPDWLIEQQRIGYADGRSLRATFTAAPDVKALSDLGFLQTHQDQRGRPWTGELLRQRVVVPELRGGSYIWFVGRSLSDDPKAPKYLALAGERPVLGLERAMGQPEVVLCEGVFDYLTATAWRLAAFSTCGTYLPADRLGFLARAQIVHGVLDPDCAGRLGTERFADLLHQRLHPIALPRGGDLNDLGLRAGGRDEFFALLAGNRSPGAAVGEQPCA